MVLRYVAYSSRNHAVKIPPNLLASFPAVAVFGRPLVAHIIPTMISRSSTRLITDNRTASPLTSLLRPRTWWRSRLGQVPHLVLVMVIATCAAVVTLRLPQRCDLYSPVSSLMTTRSMHQSRIPLTRTKLRRAFAAQLVRRPRITNSRPVDVPVATEPAVETKAAGIDELPRVAVDLEMPTQYDFTSVEQDLYKWWESNGYFKPMNDESSTSRKSYVIPMPPPNVTGYLHMGHALFVAIQDILARFHRMLGEPTLWLPGTDHAGIATQLLVERELAKENLTRQDIGREAFLKRVWAWKHEKGGYITEQMKRLGASADWDREKFTLDPELSDAVVEAFVRLHQKGLIYRGDRMVNWSPNLQTAVSDLEVEYEDRPNGKLYYFKYPLAGQDGYLPVATTRPETILGDTAVCVHPEDPRYKHLIGTEVVVPMVGRKIPIIADDYVDMEFGTGALKITPAHDPNDYEIGKKHDLDSINIMTKKASMNGNAGNYQGLDRYECRNQLWKDMEEEGLTLNITKHATRVPISQRGGEMIEPMVSTQWFVDAKGMGDKALSAVRSGDVKFVPPRFERMWDYWLEDIRDWCISRQLWWGHRIPVWHVVKDDGSLLSDDRMGTEEQQQGYVVARNEDEAYEEARKVYGKDVQLKQDNDVLDTWFSSGLWPFATMGWPNTDTDDYKKFYPAAILETGYDILFFWVARMVMMGMELTDTPPFETIYLHGLVRDGQGKKMSKTTGNVIDPIETIDKYGADALRYSLVTGGAPGQDVPLSMEKVEGNRNFANKLWNAGRYLVQMIEGANISDQEREELAVKGTIEREELDELPLAERYIVSRLHDVTEKVSAALHDHKIAEAGALAYDFLWNQYTNWYLEATKVHVNRKGDADYKHTSLKTLVYVFDNCLRLLHPFMPYITETLWQRLPHEGEALMVASWPYKGENLARNTEAEDKFALLQDIVNAVRSARAEYKVEPGKKVAASILVADEENLESLKEEKDVLAFIGRIDESTMNLTAFENYKAPEGNTVKLVIREGVEAYLPLAQMVDVEKETARLNKQAEKMLKDIDLLNKRLSSKGFVDKAPPAKVEETRQQLEDKRAQLATITETITQLSA